MDESCMSVDLACNERGVSSSSSSPLTTRLCGDVLVAIAEWLPSASLGALTLCGNRRLNGMFVRHVPSLIHQVETRNFAWPFFMRHWKNLKHLEVQYPGRASNLSNMDSKALVALARRVLESLPASLESLHLYNMPLNFRSAVRVMWEEHCNTPPSNPSTAVEVFHTSGNLDILSKLRLPNLHSFSLSKHAVSTHSESLLNWLGQIKTLSLTSLSLRRLTLSSMDQSLCSVFYALPRTLTNLELDIENQNHDAHFINPFDMQHSGIQKIPRPLLNYNSTPAIVDHCANALPPHLTRLKLTLQKGSHLPAIALSRLSNLVTLNLKMIHFHRAFSDRDSDARVLTHLPPSVTSLSLNGFSPIDLALYLSSIPEEHVNLRHLTIERVAFPITMASPESYEFFYIITSGLPFRRLESLHIFCDNKEPFIRDIFHPTDDVTQLDAFPYAGIRHMIHLRSVSRFFLWPCFIAHIMCNPAFLNANAPMKICDRKGFTPVMDLSNPQWYRHFQSESYPPRLAIDSLFLIIENPQHDRALITSTNAQALRTTFEGVKHLILSNFIGIEILKDWPGRLEKLDVLPSAIIPSDMAFDFSWESVHYLHTLKIYRPMKVDDPNAWLRLLPETLELLDMSMTCDDDRATSGARILTYVPPRLQRMIIRGGFAIGTATVDAVRSSSLRFIEWEDLLGMHCHVKELSRLPRSMRCVRISISLVVRVSETHIQHYENDLERWWKASPYLEYISFTLQKCQDQRVTFVRRS